MVSKRVRSVSESATMRIAGLASELQRKGVDVISFSLGEPDFITPPHICEAAKDALDAGETHYTPSAGIPELREEIALKLQRENNLQVKPSEIIVTPGAKQAIFEAVMSVVDDGDEVILFDPAWVSYDACVRLAGGRSVWVPTDPDDGFKPENLAEHITAKTRLIIVNTPCNPTGAVYDNQVLREISELASDRDLLVLSDEIYEKVIYGREHESLASFDGMEERTITVNGFSKAYAMTGWRLGYLAAPLDLVSQMMKVNSHSVSQAASFVQHAGIAALKGDQQCVIDKTAEFEKRRNLLVKGLNELGLTTPLPDGAFYAFTNVSKHGSGDEIAERLLREAHVAVTPGSAFGSTGENYIRISYATSQERIKEALLRIEKALS
ncbi:aspartate aminotransferase [Methanosarcinales archaeon ex4572_44]|nr:MAG: aspartate aminotransferase [Methanosarcinales archaeon ex4484_138]PHP45573.1 MAG: aspartate aminotransferase [Methanosarcinales archaeon ex4572_44]